MYKYIWIFVAVFFVGCSPRYVTQNQYIPVDGNSFSQCIYQIEEEKKLCDENCRLDYQICLDDGYQKAHKIYEKRMFQFNSAYDNYLYEAHRYRRNQIEFDRQYRHIEKDYNYFSKECNTKKDGFTCKRRNDLENNLIKMRKGRIREPREPRKPIFNSILRAQQNYCKSDCGCQNNYDRGYQNCGGQVIMHRICVENCD